MCGPLVRDACQWSQTRDDQDLSTSTMSAPAFPETLPFEETPKPYGTRVNKIATPYYVLAWRIDPIYLPTCDPSGIGEAFLKKWCRLCVENPLPFRVPRPSLKIHVGGYEDVYFYFVVATNRKDPKHLLREDFDYAEACLPELMSSFESKVDVKGTFKWYRYGPPQLKKSSTLS
ncbi:hypothetical protein MKEN_00140000 [Mycena kentingensis (nom. inval.)]|nr:hypothetical protein MKEN_00140000 [Mycena kentingensis (nom. inval.)]